MALASLEDINVHLPSDKLSVLEATDDDLQRDAERIIRGYLSGSYMPTVLASWVSPETTPEYIRGIAGRLIAAFTYARAYSEDSTEYPQYAQNKYNEAMKMIQNVQNGLVELLGVDGVTQIEQAHSVLDFWPNDDTDRKFTMGMQF